MTGFIHWAEQREDVQDHPLFDREEPTFYGHVVAWYRWDRARRLGQKTKLEFTTEGENHTEAQAVAWVIQGRVSPEFLTLWRKAYGPNQEKQ